jgi:dihydrofolate reductase
VRKIIVSEFVTADGVMEAPGGNETSFVHGGWENRYQPGPDGERFKLDEVKAAGGLLLGRVTYDLFVKFWPSMPPDPAGFSAKMNGMPKYVVSTTLKSPSWQNTTVIRLSDVAALKAGRGDDLVVYGSANLVQGLTDLHLVDEYRLIVYPTALGSGKTLFGTLKKPVNLTLTDMRRFGDGVILLTYTTA